MRGSVGENVLLPLSDAYAFGQLDPLQRSDGRSAEPDQLVLELDQDGFARGVDDVPGRFGRNRVGHQDA